MNATISGEYHGKAGPLFSLYFKTAFLTLITLGIYRFWAKTRIRKYIWSATSGDGDSFEYTGTGLEKLLGFLFAIVVLAIYLGIVQMALFYFGLNLFTEPRNDIEALAQVGAIYITLLAVLPLLLFAAYRARRYKTARTRWRGLRFGMDNGAWGYVWRALGHGLLTLITLGILLPRQTFWLEKYMTDRMWYGDAKFEQSGRWQSLYPGLKHVLFAVLLIGIGTALGISAESPFLVIGSAFVGYIWLIVGGVYYRIYAFNVMTRAKVLDGAVTFDSGARTGRVVWIVLTGIAAIIGATIVGVLVMGLVLMASLGLSFGSVASVFGDAGPGDFDPSGGILGGILVAVLYVALILALGGLSLVMITQRIIGHVVSSVVVGNAPHLEQVRQRAADPGADAEGFADALDIGGAI
ncbi:YjgN family protein [Pseudosulfitobacter koreensis]|uniref:YjgN family protein n=1 Tax=Pseudosulfitobacter koreensis TaxID=2968472 RepID=A0ABT1YVN1_9RHOB|nr:YjgN family protein [Pseudosulfitobacter koreense]MCR8824916.1 YjgN family protein [Pseudosulfitobacter koreense]